jgi:hypothetical protein
MSTRTFPTPAEDRSSTAAQLYRLAPTSPLRALAFWLAVLLPFLHVPLLVAGVGAPGRLPAYLGLVGLNAVALVVGHSYEVEP